MNTFAKTANFRGLRKMKKFSTNASDMHKDMWTNKWRNLTCYLPFQKSVFKLVRDKINLRFTIRQEPIRRPVIGVSGYRIFEF